MRNGVVHSSVTSYALQQTFFSWHHLPVFFQSMLSSACSYQECKFDYRTLMVYIAPDPLCVMSAGGELRDGFFCPDGRRGTKAGITANHDIRSTHT